ncbi:NUDIX domain-containing protein [Halorubrum ruber]|uniref:NUDIX domain-containing protein n=1 Tax=Halorubrum ruber TaxID=2982524 RepID=A0A8T8LL05_9EURY|nr:NUDIX domain-containing protein [Halorubrum ruber]QUO47727.1 NUDIX domain-containing protein [Halorubrum ruber]
MSEWISDDVWEAIVENMPIVSVDLVVECPDGVVLGKRANEPAKGEWFVPGGRVRKGERLERAVHRIAEEELGIGVEIRDSLGAFQHFYETSEIGCEKHYVAHGFHVWTEATNFDTDKQHKALDVFERPPPNLHEYVRMYIDETSWSENSE